MSDTAFGDIGGYVFSLFGGPINWKSVKQKTITMSSIEVELLALTNAVKEVYHWK